MIKLAIDFHEGTQDYATCYWYEGLSGTPFKLQDYAKPDDVSNYTNNWKQGLYTYQHNLIKDYTKDPNVTIIDL